MNTAHHKSTWSRIRSVFVVVLSVVMVTMLFRLTEAGSLTPVSAPAPSMQSLEDLYQSLVGTFDSSAVVGDKNGSALEISKCIILKVAGGTPCP